MANIKVAVRVRPISSRESNLTGSEVVVHTESNEISLTNLKVSSSKAGDSRERIRKYGFDYCFDSSNPVAQNFADQASIYQTLGRTVLDNVFTGYNSCLVAYGQSASGKTYTMMGTKEDPGLTPRLCEGLFARIEEERKNERNYGVSVSYLEIYNERVRDLLKPSSSTGGLRVREHPRLGPYVQGLTHHVVRTLGSLMSCVEEGTRARKTASTLQNPSSSRSHALLTIVVAEGSASEASSRARRASRGGSKLRLVDLAGSESAATCAGVHRLKEGANINKSLVALGNVISALAERGTSPGSGPGRRFIPYRDSSLTWLLKDALGGNATTIMLATISPASGSYNETARTLRFAQRAQSVVNRPMVNEDPVARIVRELRAEVARLKSLLLEKNTKDPDTKVLCRCRKGIREELIGTEGVGSCERNSKGGIGSMVKEGKRRKAVPLERSNSTDTVATYHQLVPCSTGRRFGSLEFFESDRFAAGYNRARVTELKEEEGAGEEVSEIHESVFVDIPTLVAVLIKPDNNPDESSVRIEEIYSDEVVDESSNDVEFIEGDRSYETQNSRDDNDIYNANGDSCPRTGQQVDKPRERKRKFRKQDSVDAIPSLTNLHASRKFGSVEAIQRRDHPAFSFERSYTSLEKPLRPASSTIPDRVAKKLNDIREVEDRRKRNSSGGGKSNERLERKGSNDSDRSAKTEMCGANQSNGGCRARSYGGKPSLESLRRKSSKDSSSSSSKDEQISTISTGRGDKSSSRKNSLEQDSSSILKNHTPIQKVKRAEIVAAVTERLYSSKRSAEDSPGMRSPTGEGTVDGATKSLARLKLQEISRKMLGKRRRVSVDTQTDCSRTVRMRDTASLTETEPIARRDVAISTDHRQVCEYRSDKGFGPVLRVKEMATSTDKPRTVVSVVRCRDVGSSATDLEDYDYGMIHSPRNDSGILSDDGQNYYAGSSNNPSSVDVSDFCQEGERRRGTCTESSTNTSSFSSTCRSFAVQTLRRLDQQPACPQPACPRRCCAASVQHHQSGERSVISISLPDSVSITIESASRGSRISKDATKDESAQTRALDEEETLSRSRDRTVSTPSQTDGKVFRIENIFHDPNNAVERSYSSKSSPRGTGGEERIPRNSITLRNSLGTSHVSQGEETGHELEEFVRDGLITEAFINRKRESFTSRRRDSFVYQDSSSSKNEVSIAHSKETEAPPSFWQLEIGGNSLKTSRDVASFRHVSGSNDNHDNHGFSDDSLDYNESNVSGDDPTTSLLKVKQGMGEGERESFCPPDVVAHTKKNCPKSIEADPKNEPVADFERDRGEFPMRNPGKLAEIVTDAHGHESLTIFGGKPFRNYGEEMESDVSPSNSGRKKKVSFSSSTTVSEKRFDSIGVLKSIIKRRRRRNAAADESLKSFNPVLCSSNEETEDSRQEGRGGLISKGGWREEIRSGSSEEGKEDELAFEEEESSRKNRGKFFADESSCSESESYENVEEEEEEEEEEENRNVLEEYLSEAVTLMRNLNSGTSACRASLAHRGRSGTPSSWDLRDRSKFTIDRRGVEPTNPPRIDDFSIDASMEISYERCVKGIQRLEDCIRRIDRHNELLKEKYGLDCESAGSRPDLANPSTDSHRASSNDDDEESKVLKLGTREVGSKSSSSVAERKDDLERKIFDQLMNVANSIRYRRSNVGLETSKSPTNAKFRETKEPRHEEVRGNLEETAWNDLDRQDFATYEITGNVSVGRTCRFMPDRNSDVDCNDLDELPSRRPFDRSSRSRDRAIFGELAHDDEDDELELWSSCNFPTKREARARNWGRGGNSPVQGWKRFQETDDCSRWGARDVAQGCRGCTCGSRDRSDIEAGVEARDKLRYPASPRARFLELLRERRRIVECCRGASAS